MIGRQITLVIPHVAKSQVIQLVLNKFCPALIILLFVFTNIGKSNIDLNFQKRKHFYTVLFTVETTFLIDAYSWKITKN